MTDTTPEAQKKQVEIMLAMPMQERFMHGADMIDFTRQIVENSIRRINPNISATELKVAVFKRYYGHEFSTDRVDAIIHYLKTGTTT